MVLLIPYIILSNTVLVSVFSFMKKTPKLGVLTASLLKFGFLYSITLVLAQQLNNPLITMFQWPQLITALLGGIGFLSLKKVSKIS
jgi:uncharacterized membrane protein YGL010W